MIRARRKEQGEMVRLGGGEIGAVKAELDGE